MKLVQRVINAAMKVTLQHDFLFKIQVGDIARKLGGYSVFESHTLLFLFYLWCPQMKELHTLGFRDTSQCEEALRLSGGEVKGALSLLQRPMLEPFHQRIWTDQPEPPIDPKHPDKQVRFYTGATSIARPSINLHLSLVAADVPAFACALRPAKLGTL